MNRRGVLSAFLALPVAAKLGRWVRPAAPAITLITEVHTPWIMMPYANRYTTRTFSLSMTVIPEFGEGETWSKLEADE